jgi:hypothetical protein
VTGFGTYHLFDGFSSNALIVDAPGAIVLKWADKWGESANDYDLFLFNSDLSQIVYSSVDVQNGEGFPIEVIDSSAFSDADHRLVIALYQGSARYLHLNALTGELQFSTAGQIYGHPSAARAVAVAAADVGTAAGGAFVGGAANPVEPFSSDGPRRMFFAPDGQPYTPGNFSASGGTVRQKPELTGATRVVTSTPGYELFPGTSAAAPHVAAIMALTLSAGGGPNAFTVDALRTLMFSSTLDIEAAGVDRDSGYGILDAYTAVMAAVPPPNCSYSITPTSASFPHGGGAGSVTVTAAAGCSWTATSNAGFITLISGASGSGAGSVTYSVASTVAARAGTMTIAGLTFAVAQAGPAFTDEPLTTSHVISAVHITELRQRVNAVREARGLSAFSWTDGTITPRMTVVRAVHLTELRSALAQAYAAANRTPPTFTDATIVAGVTPVRAVHITELRDAVKAIE